MLELLGVSELITLEELLNEKILDKVIIVPTGLHYSYKNNLVSNEHRYNMLKLMTKHNDKIEISDFEFKDEEIHSFDTLEYYKNIYKNDIKMINKLYSYVEYL